MNRGDGRDSQLFILVAKVFYYVCCCGRCSAADSLNRSPSWVTPRGRLSDESGRLSSWTLEDEEEAVPQWVHTGGHCWTMSSGDRTSGGSLYPWATPTSDASVLPAYEPYTSSDSFRCVVSDCSSSTFGGDDREELEFGSKTTEFVQRMVSRLAVKTRGHSVSWGADCGRFANVGGGQGEEASPYDRTFVVYGSGKRLLLVSEKAAPERHSRSVRLNLPPPVDLTEAVSSPSVSALEFSSHGVLLPEVEGPSHYVRVVGSGDTRWMAGTSRQSDAKRSRTAADRCSRPARKKPH